MSPLTAVFLLCLLALAGPLQARVDLLLVPPTDTVEPPRRPVFTLYLNNPTEYDELVLLDREILAEFADASGHREMRMELVDATQRRVTVPKMSRRTVLLRPEADLTGRGEFLSLRLRSPATNAIMFRPAPADVASPGLSPVAATLPPSPSASAPAVTRRGLGRRHIDLTSDIEHMRRHISGYEPIYFAVGWRERFNARFQFSFKYRPVDPGPDNWDTELWPTLMGKVHFAYTQTSIWDLAGFSKPFYDSSYKPTLFLLHTLPLRAGSNWTFSLQAGAQHESNGKGRGLTPVPSTPGLISNVPSPRHPFESRSLNTLYVLPRARWQDGDEHFFEAALRTSAFFQTDENPDIMRYRGYTELTLRGGYVRGLQLSAHLRGKADGHGSVEFNLTWPATESPLLRHFPLVGTLGGYAQLQYFNGYGESLLDYDVRRKDQLRFGLMIVR